MAIDTNLPAVVPVEGAAGGVAGGLSGEPGSLSGDTPSELPKKVLSEEYKKRMLSNAVYHLTEQDPFSGNLLQEITIKYNEMVPTAAITYNVKSSQYEVYVNPYFFDRLTAPNRRAVLLHEILHFTHKHLFRLPFIKNETSEEDRKLYNIAGDGAINQLITDLPEGCVRITEWKMDDGTFFPANKTMEQYYELIKQEQKQQQKSEDDKAKGKGEGTKGDVLGRLAGYKEFDQHDWDALDEETKKKMLEEAKKIIKRSIEKTSTTYTKIPDSVKDLLVEIDHMAAGLNYKTILRQVIKKTVSCVDRETTWKKPNKRYGVVSPGTKVGSMPNLSFYLDTSGSISLKELNEFLHIMSEFLKIGTRNCWLGLWHTTLYYKKKYKLHAELNKEELQSGGTDVQGCIADIKKTQPNLAIILTDMYFEPPNLTTYSGEILFIVSEGGNKNHGFNLPPNCKVICLENLK